MKVIVNLVVKAITAPFSLLASVLGGGGDELSMVSFAPGVATLSPEAKAGLDKVAKALADRPALKLTVVGTARLDIEREAYQLARLDAMLAAEQRRMAVVSGGAVSPAGRADLMKEVYKRADLTKPRNLVGMAKDIPVADMEALLLANLPATEDAMRELALQRGVAVKDYLVQKQLPAERLFLGAEKGKAEPTTAAAPAGASSSAVPSGSSKSNGNTPCAANASADSTTSCAPIRALHRVPGGSAGRSGHSATAANTPGSTNVQRLNSMARGTPPAPNHANGWVRCEKPPLSSPSIAPNIAADTTKITSAP